MICSARGELVLKKKRMRLLSFATLCFAVAAIGVVATIGVLVFSRNECYATGIGWRAYGLQAWAYQTSCMLVVERSTHTVDAFFPSAWIKRYDVRSLPTNSPLVTGQSFYWNSARMLGNRRIRIAFPTVCVGMLAIAPAMLGIWQIRRRRQRSSGIFCVCGYDLRGSDVRCPECGHVLTSAARP